jgi:UDP:flavonoid glycosyltransferase YjiC (YdhE family)
MAMIRLLSVGSRGDLQPYLAILLELQRRGHSVQLIGSINFEAIATEHAVPFVPLPGDYRQLLRSKQGLKMMRGRPVQLVSKQLLEAMLTTADAAMAGTDLLLLTPLALWGYHLAEAEGCPLMVLSPIPIIATGNFAFLQFPGSADPAPPSRIGQRLRGRLNRLSYHSVSLLKWRQDSGVIQTWRRNKGLAPLPWGGARSRRDAPAQLANPAVLHLFSPRVLARPADWQESASVAGYCFLESRPGAGEILASSYQPVDELREFLDSGDRPFYAGFGSMISRDPAALGSLLVEAARIAGQRLILSPGWGRIVPRTALPASVYVLEECPHSWLFPQLRGAIHHGGAGTTATTLRHGLPSTVVAFFADQPAWGRTLERLGVSPATHRLPSLSAETLARSMGAIANNPSFRIRAQELQQMLGGENGVGNVVAAIEAKLIEDGVMEQGSAATQPRK